MTLPLLTSVVVDDSSSSLSDDTPGVATPPSGVATPPSGVATSPSGVTTPPPGVAAPPPGVATPLFNSNAFRHVNLSNPEPNIHRHADDVTASDDFRIHRHADDVTASDDFRSALPLSTGDPRRPDVAFARSLVNPCLRAPEPDSRNGGGTLQDKSNTSSPDDSKEDRYLRELNDRKITYQEAMTSDRCEAELHAVETANELLPELADLHVAETSNELLPELSSPAAPVREQDRPTDTSAAVTFNLVMSWFTKAWAAMDSGAMKHLFDDSAQTWAAMDYGAMKHLFDDSTHLDYERPPLAEETMMSASCHIIRPFFRPSKVVICQLHNWSDPGAVTPWTLQLALRCQIIFQDHIRRGPLLLVPTGPSPELGPAGAVDEVDCSTTEPAPLSVPPDEDHHDDHVPDILGMSESKGQKFSRTKNLLGSVKTRRWLYLGFSEDRIGMRVFDPETREVGTRWHLTFNEPAMYHRTSRLREFDGQMDAYRKGHWSTLFPLIADDYDMFNSSPEALQSALRFRSIFQDHTRKGPQVPTGPSPELGPAGHLTRRIPRQC